MPRGRKRKATTFIPQRWIHNPSSEDDDHDYHEDPLLPIDHPGEGK